MAALLPVNDAAVYTAINNYEKYFTNLQKKTEELARKILVIKDRIGSVGEADYFDLQELIVPDFVAAGLMCSRDLLQKKQSGRPDESKTQELFSHLQNTKDRISDPCLSVINDAENDCKRKLEVITERRDSISIADKLDFEMLLKRKSQITDVFTNVIRKISDLQQKMLETL